MLLLWRLLAVPLWAAESLPGELWVEREIASGQVHEWVLAAGTDYVEMETDARGTRLHLDGLADLTDAPMRPVRLCWIQRPGGIQSIRVRSAETAESRRYALRLSRRSVKEGDSHREEGCRNHAAVRGARTMAAKLALLTAARDAFEKAGDTRGVAEVLTPMGALFWELGRPADSLAAHERAVTAWETMGNRGRQAEAMAKLGTGYYLSPGRHAEGAALLKRALELARAAADTFAEGLVAESLINNSATTGAIAEPQELARRTIGLAERAGDRASQAGLWNGLARIEFNTFLQAAVESDKKALALRRRLGDEAAIAQSLNNLASGLGALGEAEAARAMLQEALEIRRRVAPPNSVANTLHNLGVDFMNTAEFDRGIALFEEALALWRQTGYKLGEAHTTTELGTAYFRRGTYDRAERNFGRALELHRGLNNRRSQANTLAQLSGLAHARGDFAEAARLAAEAVLIARPGGFHLEKSRALHWLAQAYLGMGRVDDALKELPEAKQAASGVNRHDLASVLATYGIALRRAGRPRDSIAPFAEAVSIFDELGDAAAAGGAQSGMSLSWLAAGEMEQAVAASENAVASLEDVRSRLSAGNARAEFLARRQGVFQAAVAIRVRAGDTAGALTMSEKGRARTMTDLLLARPSTSPAAASADEKRLRTSISAKSAALARLRLRRAPAAEIDALQRQVTRLHDEYSSLLEILARSQPGLMQAARTPEAKEIQNALADGEAVLEFSLGGDGAFLLIARRNAVEAVSLGPVAAIDAAVSEVRAALHPGGNAAAPLAKLDRLLLGGANLKGVRRLHVVPDAGLHFVPFGALPSLDGRPVTVVPSGAFLTAPGGGERRRGSVAIFADPVYETGDARLRAAASTTRGAAEPLRFARLRFSAKEAESIAQLTPRKTIADGFAASREAVLRAPLERAAVIHFAAHATVDPVQPSQSAIVLSLYDRQGRPVDGFLRMYDVATLRLQSPLVVLSACETAVGRTLAGEGPLTLAREFLAAGASGVVASLWPVDDAATAAFMAAFYEALLKRGQPAAQALRTAQRQVRTQRRWAAPYYWAGFIYTGR